MQDPHSLKRIRNQAGVNRLRQKFRESKSAPFRAMFELLCLEGNASEALALAEQAKLQDLLDIFDPNQVSISKGMSSQEREEEQRLADQLRSLNLQVYRERLQLEPSIDKLRELENQLKSAQFPYDTFRTALASNHPQLAAYRGQLQYASTDDLSSMLTNRRAAILEFVSTRDETYLLTVIAKPVVKELDGAGRKTSAASAPEISLQLTPLRLSRKQLSEQVYTFREKIALQSEPHQKQAEWLYQTLLKPVAPVLDRQEPPSVDS